MFTYTPRGVKHRLGRLVSRRPAAIPVNILVGDVWPPAARHSARHDESIDFSGGSSRSAKNDSLDTRDRIFVA